MASLAPHSRPNEPNGRELEMAHGYSYGLQFTEARQQRDHERVIAEFLDWLRKNRSYSVKDPQSDERAAFVPNKTVTNYLEEDGRLQDILDALFHPAEGPDADIVLPNYVAIFCTLIEIGRGPAVEHFVKQGLHDQRLPFDPNHVQPGFPQDTGDGTFYRRFCDKQWKFAVPDFEKGMERTFPDQTLLPIVKKRDVAKGGSARLFEVKVHSSHNKLLPEKDDPSSNVFAVKTYYTPDAARYYETEVDAFRKLKRCQPHNPHLITFFGSYIHAGTYNVILEYADQGSLEDYFQKIKPPIDLADISKVWVSLFGILKGLESIHRVELARPNAGSGITSILNGWHQDVKPKNILVFSNNATSPYDFTFKLADLGLSHFQKTIEGRDPATAPDSHGTSTYGAPECYRQDDFWDVSPLQVKQDVDIWSAACIYSEAAVWIARSAQGIREYRDRRLATTLQFSQRLGDAFHDGENVLGAVSSTHVELLPNLRMADTITRKVLEIVDREMLRPAGDRLNARFLWVRLAKTIPHSERGVFSGSYASYQSRPDSRGSTNQPSQYTSPTPPPPPPPGSERVMRTTEGRRTTEPKISPGHSNFQHHPRHSPSLQYPRAHSPEMLPISENERYQTDPNSFYSQSTYPESAVTDYSTPPPRMTSRGTFESTTFQPHPAPDQFENSFHTPPSQPPPSLNEGPFTQESANSDTRYTQTASHDLNSSNHVPNDRPVLPTYYHSTPDSASSRGSGPGSQVRHSLTPSSTRRPPMKERPFSLPPTHLNSSSNASSHAMKNDMSPLASKRSPSNRTKQRKKQRRSVEIPRLTLLTAMQWKANKKNSEKLKNRLRGQKAPKLQGDWLMHKCQKRDHVFIIDDALSMEPHWDNMSQLFGILAYIVKESDHDGIDMYFTMSDTKYNDRDTSKLVDIVNKRKSKLEGNSSINVRLQDVLGEYNKALTSQIARRRAGNPHVPMCDLKPLSVYVFTDGVWTPKSNPRPAIEHIVDSLEELHADDGQVGIQFISFGKDRESLERLEHLDKGLHLKRDIIDHCPWDSPEGLWKMIFGAIDAEFDEKDQDGDSDSERPLSSKGDYN